MQFRELASLLGEDSMFEEVTDPVSFVVGHKPWSPNELLSMLEHSFYPHPYHALRLQQR